MALLNIGDDPWLLEHESCEKLHRDIMQQLNHRQQHPRKTEKYDQISAAIRHRLRQYNNEVDHLKRKLNQISLTRSITLEEIERRTRQVESLQLWGSQAQKLFDEHNVQEARERAMLMGTSAVSSWDSDDEEMLDEQQKRYSVNELRQQQKGMLEDQERGLENLSKIISRQKSIAQTINTEVDLHNEIIDDLGDHIDRTDARLSSETRNISILDRKDSTCSLWVIIILLFISIVAVSLI